MGWFQNLNKKFTQSQEEARKKAEEAKLEAIKIKCPLCKGSIPANATRCSHCAGDLTGKEAKDSIKIQTEASKKRNKIAVGILIVLILVVFWYLFDYTPSSPQPPAQTTPQQSAPQTQQELLELVAFSCYSEYSFFHIEGEVKNISGKSMENVQAVGNAYTEDGTFVKSSDALIEYNPILPNQTSPFKVIMSGNPAIGKCKVDFKYLLGGTIQFKRTDK